MMLRRSDSRPYGRFVRTSWRLYGRFFDWVEDESLVDPSELEWVREHEPIRLLRFAATRRNVRRVGQLGWIVIGLSAWFVASGIWIPPLWPAVHWFEGGFLLGLGAMFVAASYGLSRFGRLRDERNDCPRPAAEEAPAR